MLETRQAQEISVEMPEQVEDVYLGLRFRWWVNSERWVNGERCRFREIMGVMGSMKSCAKVGYPRKQQDSQGNQKVA